MAQRLKLRLQLVPSNLWEFNLRSEEHGLGLYRWRKLRKDLVNECQGRCCICGSTEKLHGHEVWLYKEAGRLGVAKLERVEIVCWNCHNIMHWGHTVQMVAAGIFSPETVTAFA